MSQRPVYPKGGNVRLALVRARRDEPGDVDEAIKVFEGLLHRIQWIRRSNPQHAAVRYQNFMEAHFFEDEKTLGTKLQSEYRIAKHRLILMHSRLTFQSRGRVIATIEAQKKKIDEALAKEQIDFSRLTPEDVRVVPSINWVRARQTNRHKRV